MAAVLVVTPGVSLAATAPTAILVTEAIPSTPITSEKQIFLDKVFTFDTPDGRGSISSTPDGTGEVGVDDEIDIKVTRPDGTEQTLVRNYEFQPPSPPIDLSSVLQPGKNTIRIGLRDTFGVYYGSSALYLVGGADAGSQATKVYSPDYKIVRWFRALQQTSNLTPARCAKDFIKAALPLGVGLCPFLLNTANPAPPQDMPDSGWPDFLAKKEYRGILALPSYEVNCDGQGRATDATQQGHDFTSTGYTPTVGHNPRFYLPAAPYLGDADYAGAPQVTKSIDGRSVHVAIKTAARLFDGERVGGWVATGYDAPYIWTVLHLKISCDGHTSATLTYSDFPSMVIYQDGARAFAEDQTSEYLRFMTSAGRIPALPGRGKLSPVCHIFTFPGSTTDPIPANPKKADCERGRNDGFLPL